MGFTFPLFSTSFYCIITMKEGNCHVTQKAAPYVKECFGFSDSVGNALYSLAVVAFILPSGIITGGTTGLALASAHWFPTPITAFVLGASMS